jgi:hypothetical protein
MLARSDVSGVLVLPLTRGMPNGQNHNFIGAFVEGVVDEIGILTRHEFSDARDDLPSSDLGKKNKSLQRVKDGCPHVLRRDRCVREGSRRWQRGLGSRVA